MRDAIRRALSRVRVRRIAIGVLVLLVMGAVATLFGWEVGSWLERLWNTLTSIPAEYLVAAILLLTVQTVGAAFAWYSILRYAYGPTYVSWLRVLACYATAVALNFVLPANLGTLVMMVMFTTLIIGTTFAGIVGGFVVQKIFFTVIGTAVYAYLFLTVAGSFDLQFGFVEEHPWATAIVVVGSCALIFIVARILKPRVAVWWERAKNGGQIVAHPRTYLARVALPEALSWLAMLGVIAVFLLAYQIPVSFNTLMRIVGGNSIANMTSVTPGSAGVVQGFNALSLKDVTSASNATRYSVAQQLVSTAWAILLAIVLLIRAFGWSGGKTLVEASYSEAREKRAEQLAASRARRQARRHATP
jgi:uncharacterized membrane protein YbhN (UPF0104 family)